ncbi:MAG: hypothetical protein WBM62_05670 [Crocosphaera sp.]|jgi:hypothetical protein
MTISSNYEFNSSQNEIFKDLAQKMRFVGILLLVGGIFSIIVGLSLIFVGIFLQKEEIFIDSGMSSIIQGILFLLISSWIRKAALGFFQIVKTTNNDIENLMNAISELRKLYTLQYVLAIIMIIFIGLSLIIRMNENWRIFFS